MRLSLLILILLLTTLLRAQPITGEAKKLEFKGDRIIYSGNVKLTRGESVLKADKVVIVLDKTGKPLKIVATGRVFYKEPGRKATAQYAEYDLRKEIIILRGKARVEEEKNILEADQILYDRKNQTLEAKGDKVRTIYIEEEKDEEVRHNEGNSPQKGNIPEKGENNS